MNIDWHIISMELLLTVQSITDQLLQIIKPPQGENRISFYFFSLW